jgi:hypothetical protein
MKLPMPILPLCMTLDELKRSLADLHGDLGQCIRDSQTGEWPEAPRYTIERLMLRVPCFCASMPGTMELRPAGRVLSLQAPTFWARWLGCAKPFEVIVFVRVGRQSVYLRRNRKPRRSWPTLFPQPNLMLLPSADEVPKLDKLIESDRRTRIMTGVLKRLFFRS